MSRAPRAALRDRQVQYTGEDSTTVRKGGALVHVPTDVGTVVETMVDENGKIHLRVSIIDSKQQESKWWAPLCEWATIDH